MKNKVVIWCALGLVLVVGLFLVVMWVNYEQRQKTVLYEGTFGDELAERYPGVGITVSQHDLREWSSIPDDIHISKSPELFILGIDEMQLQQEPFIHVYFSRLSNDITGGFTLQVKYVAPMKSLAGVPGGSSIAYMELHDYPEGSYWYVKELMSYKEVAFRYDNSWFLVLMTWFTIFMLAVAEIMVFAAPHMWRDFKNSPKHERNGLVADN